MKKLYVFIILLLTVALTISAQPPQAFKYRAVARDKYGRLIINQKVAVRISLLQGNENGIPVYTETHTPVSNSFGIIELEIGKGNASLGSIENIDWGISDYFIKVEMDPKCRQVRDYSVIGTSQLLSVPYALYAGHVQNSEDNDADPLNELISNAYLSGTVLTLQEGGTTTLIDLSGLQEGFEDGDADPENEIQDLKLVDNILTITRNGMATEIDLSVYLDDTDTRLTEAEVDAMVANNGYLTDDADFDPTNELQVLSIGHDTIYLSDGGYVKLPAAMTSGGQYYYLDKDNDGYGNRYTPVWVPTGVSEPEDFVSDRTDCDDEDQDINLSALEIADDGIDNNCNGEVDESYSDPLYVDDDGDGFSEMQGDCNDSLDFVYPGAIEICGDGIDQDCNGTNPYCDSDGDGVDDRIDNCPFEYNRDQRDRDMDRFGEECDCDDADSGIHPAATEICGDGIDQDCDGQDRSCDTDSDGDGIIDSADNCPSVANADQADEDADGVGNLCDSDFNDEGIDLIELKNSIEPKLLSFNLDQLIDEDPLLNDDFENHTNCTSPEPDFLWPETGWFIKRANCTVYSCLLNMQYNYNNGFGVRKNSSLLMNDVTIEKITQDGSTQGIVIDFVIKSPDNNESFRMPFALYGDLNQECSGDVNIKINGLETIDSLRIRLKISIDSKSQVITLHPSDVSFNGLVISFDLSGTFLATEANAIRNSIGIITREYLEQKLIDELFILVRQAVITNIFS